MPTGAHRPAPGPPTITVVVVDQRLGDQIADLLCSAGLFVVATAATRAQGFEVVTRHRPAVAVIDSHLPDGSGVQLCRELAPAAADTALLLHSALALRRDQREALAAGARAVVPKALRGHGLVSAIRAHAGTGSGAAPGLTRPVATPAR